jgi:hypothetical protein
MHSLHGAHQVEPAVEQNERGRYDAHQDHENDQPDEHFPFAHENLLAYVYESVSRTVRRDACHAG